VARPKRLKALGAEWQANQQQAEEQRGGTAEIV
jgi:hypothetical protein